ncbi:MAG: outer membrane lipoprotein chaperone LolA [Bdellovibrionales bacterium]|nr:outer membrane lipoprotein chaperone LolA [Bdellovibrionales bacterium]
MSKNATAMEPIRFSTVVLVLLGFPGFFFNASAAPKKSLPKQLPPLLAEVEDHYTKSGTLAAQFDQEDASAAFAEKKSSKGSLAWKTPNLIRWETRTPDQSLLVSNGKTVWMYTPPFDESENGQVIIRPASQVKSRILDALLAGRFSAALKQGLRIESLGARSFALQPAPGTVGDLKIARVEIAEKEPLIEKVGLEYQNGNQSSIRLSKIEMGKALASSLFEFKIPPRTDVVKD